MSNGFYNKVAIIAALSNSAANGCKPTVTLERSVSNIDFSQNLPKDLDSYEKINNYEKSNLSTSAASAARGEFSFQDYESLHKYFNAIIDLIYKKILNRENMSKNA